MDTRSNTMLHIILLAAGNSSRFGANKLLHKVNGKTMFQHTLEVYTNVLSFFNSEIIVVTKYDSIEREVENYKLRYTELTHRVNLGRNDRTELGISESIRVGLSHVTNEYNMLDRSPNELDNTKHYYLFSVCDQPFLTSQTILAFLNEFIQSNKSIGCLAYGETMGNPVIFDQRYKEELYGLTGDVGGKRVLKKHMDEVYLFFVENQEELVDMDTRDAMP